MEENQSNVHNEHEIKIKNKYLKRIVPCIHERKKGGIGKGSGKGMREETISIDRMYRYMCISMHN